MTLIDENVEEIDFDRLGRADLVCLTGMSIEGRRLIEILEEDEVARRYDCRWRTDGNGEPGLQGSPTSSSWVKLMILSNTHATK